MKIRDMYYCLPINTVLKMKSDFKRSIGTVPRYGSGALTQAARSLSADHMKCKDYAWFYVTEKFFNEHMTEDSEDATARKLAGEKVWGPVAGIDSNSFKRIYNDYKLEHKDPDILLEEAKKCVIIYR